MCILFRCITLQKTQIMDLKVVIIGAGNLATCLSLELKKHQYNILQVYSRSEKSACALAEVLGCHWTNELHKVERGADLYILSVSDRVYEVLLPQLNFGNALVIHTSGSMSMQILAPYSQRIGVFYPLQTFTKGRTVDFTVTPVCIEAVNRSDFNILKSIGEEISGSVHEITTEQRKRLHLAAVFCSNFVNHCYALACEIAKEQQVEFDLLKPLIRETAAKIETMSPVEAQTGPAVRYDENVMNRQKEMLTDHPLWKELYERMSKSIFELQTKK